MTASVGTDLSYRLCRMCRDRSDARVTQADAQRLPFRSMSFRTVFMTEVLEHIPRPEDALREIWRVLRMGGVCYLTVPNRDWPRYDKYLERRERFQPVDDHFYRVAEIEALARRAGLAVAALGGDGSIYHGGVFWGALERLLMVLFPHFRHRRKRLFVKLLKTSDSAP